jgi:drug/metabolite transporter (DMT)-like permease
VVWVALLAVPVLGERIRWWNAGAIALLLLGQIALTSGVGDLAANRGEILVLAATLLWSVEVVVAKWLLRGFSPASLALVRMGVGGVTLLVYLAIKGQLHLLTSFGASQVRWALLTGLLLAAYVGTWMGALRLARAIDVSSILVLSVVVTALLQDVAGSAHLAPQWGGLLLIAIGTALVAFMCTRARARVGPVPGPT